MIQIITKDSYAYKNKFKNKEIVVSAFSEYKSFDLYDINVINLASNSLWNCTSSCAEYLNDKSDLATIKNSINTCNTKVLILFPQNHYFQYSYSNYSNKYQHSAQLKSIKDIVNRFLTKYIYEPLPVFNYDKGLTKIEDETYNSDFYFDQKEGLIFCEKSKKTNTVALGERIVITTLNVFEQMANKDIEKRIFVLLNKIGFLTQNETIPQWIDDITFYDDSVYEKEIEKCNKEIKKIKDVITQNREKLNNNLKYKSILYSSGNALSEQVNKMLKTIFELDGDFVDVYEEDFNFKAGGMTFIVETKGLNNEVSGQNVSDAYNHLVIYDDKLERDNISEDTKCLFFVASERFKAPDKRSKIKERQITIAKRNKTLIIETTTFYNLFEDFIKKEISATDILKLFKQKTGLLEYNKTTGD